MAPVDVRVNTVKYDVQNKRYREFSEVAPASEDTIWPDSPISGPPTYSWVLKFMKEHGGTPLGWHQRFVTICKLTPTDGGVANHESWCRLIEIAECFDQVNGGALAHMEFAARQVQFVEERWKERVVGKDEIGVSEASLFSGVSNRHNLCICPALTSWIAEEMRKESSVLKERRKAREERALVKPPKG